MPTSNLRHYLEHYFAPHPSHQVRELFVSTALIDFASASVGLFEPIYLLSLGYGIHKILLYYFFLYLLFFILLPIGGRIGSRYGYEHAILFSSPFLILYYLALFGAQWIPGLLVAAPVLYATQKVLYWPAYHANFAVWSKKEEQGREVSNSRAITALASAFAPIFGGIVATFAGFGWLFVISAILILLSNFALMKTPELAPKKPFPYMRSMRMLVDRRHRRDLLSFIGFGEELIALVLWPIFIVLILQSPMAVGIVVSLAMSINVLITLYVGRLADEDSKTSVLRTGVVYAAASWLVRPLVIGGLGIFLIDSFYRVTKNTMTVPLLALLYDKAHRHSAMEHIVFMEMALAVGKMTAIGLCALSFWIFPTSWIPIFLIAAAFTVLFGLIRESGDTGPVR